MSLLNSIFTLLFNALLFPMRPFAPVWGMIFISLLAGLLMLWIYGKISNQAAIKRARTLISGNLLGVRLYRHEVGVVMKLQARIIRDTLVYMKHSLKPMLIMLVPMGFILAQLNLNFASRPLKSGERTLLKVKVRDAETLKGKIELEAPKEIVVETAPVRIASEREIAWRIRADKNGRHQVKIKTNNGEISKEIVSGDQWGAISAIRTGVNLWERFLYPGESAIASNSPFVSVEVKYASLPLTVLGWNVNWLVLFFILTMVFGFALKDLFGVQI